MHKNGSNISKEWKRVSQIMRNMNRENKTNFTMRYVFGVPTTDRLDNLKGIHSKDELLEYIGLMGIKAPPAPKIEDMTMNRLLNRYNFMPEEFQNTLFKFLTQLAETVDHRIMQEAIKSIIWTLDTDFKYDVSNYGRNFPRVIKEVAELARDAEPDKIKEIDDIEEQALEAAEQAILTSAYNG